MASCMAIFYGAIDYEERFLNLGCVSRLVAGLGIAFVDSLSNSLNAGAPVSAAPPFARHRSGLLEAMDAAS
jgi:hypothetical protein